MGKDIEKPNAITFIADTSHFVEMGKVKGVAKGFASNKIGKDGLTGKQRASKCGKKSRKPKPKKVLKILKVIHKKRMPTEEELKDFWWINEIRKIIVEEEKENNNGPN